jgi:hypothetical protein
MRVIHKTSDIKTRFFEYEGVYDKVWSINDMLWIDRIPRKDHI